MNLNLQLKLSPRAHMDGRSIAMHIDGDVLTVCLDEEKFEHFTGYSNFLDKKQDVARAFLAVALIEALDASIPVGAKS